MYGHFDKQPPFDGWLPGLGPYEPVVKDGKLYGRGAADGKISSTYKNSTLSKMETNAL